MNGRQKYKNQVYSLVLLHVLGYFACQKNMVYYKRTTVNPSKKYIERI